MRRSQSLSIRWIKYSLIWLWSVGMHRLVSRHSFPGALLTSEVQIKIWMTSIKSRTKTIEAMRSWLWRLSSWSPSSDASYLSHGAHTKIFCIRWSIFFLPETVAILLLSISWLQKHYGSFPRFFFHSSILCLCGFYPVAFLWWVWKRWTACTNKIEAYSRHFQRSPFFLLPWILVSCVLGMVAEMYLFWAAGIPQFRDFVLFTEYI